jgi:hypothetical protein
MKFICKYSGLEIQTSHFPGYIHTATVCHPAFELDAHKILSYAPKFLAGQLTETDQYLLFLAGLHSTSLVSWRTQAQYNAKTMQICAQNMHTLFSVLSKLDVFKHPSFACPRYIISADTRNLASIRYWLASWLKAYEDFNNGYRSVSLQNRIIRREAALERLIKSRRPTESYAKVLADWASLAGDFPKFSVTVGTDSNARTLSCSEYWKEIIVRIGKKDSIWTISQQDLQELITHCEDNIEAGSIYSHTLMKYLRTAYEDISNPLGFGVKTSFKILDDMEDSAATSEQPESIEAQNLRTILSTAASEEPRQENYPTKFEYIKAKMIWQLAQKKGFGG